MKHLATLLSVHPKRNRHITRLAISLLVTLIVSVPMAYLAAPHLKRWTRIHWLTSADLDQRQRGLKYVASYAGEDPRVLAGAVGQLRVEDDANYQQIVGALRSAGCWQRGKIPDDPWLRWIGLLASESGVEAGSLAAQRLADLYDFADDPRVVTLLEGLLRRDEPDVRYNALCAVAELTMSATNQSPYERMIAGRISDTEPLIVRHAWLFSYYLDMPLDDAPAWLARAIESTQRPYKDDEHFTLKAIRALLLSPDAPLRDVGCVLAVRDLEDDALDALVADLLRDMNDQATMSGAILSGLTGLHLDMLRRRAKSEDDWAVSQVLRLGLWMRDGNESVTEQVTGWLIRDDLPHSTILLAMLHREATRGRALDYLLNPRGESPNDLPALLDDYGWWRVLNHYLSPTTLNWRPGTDPQQQQLQVDLLRDWYLVNRHRLKENRLDVR